MSNTDFDFLYGTWDVANRRLLKPLTGSDEWETFPARSHCRPFFDGAGNLDEIVFPTKGFSGATFRTWEVENQRWSIYWVNSRTGTLQPPVFGTFVDENNGEFYGWDEHDGEKVKVSYLWTVHGPDKLTWKQGFSLDDGATWEINWVMDCTRVS